jgi:ribosome-binding protein aMBF1 (putative translation factor)
VTPGELIGRHTRAYREDLGLSQGALAHRTGLSQSFLSRLEPWHEATPAALQSPSLRSMSRLRCAARRLAASRERGAAAGEECWDASRGCSGVVIARGRR